MLLAATGVVAACGSGSPGPSPAGQAPPVVATDPDDGRPAPSALLDAALLAPTGLGEGWRQSSHPPEPPPWPWLQADCPAYRDADYPAQRHRTGAVQRRYRHDGSAMVATHVVEAYEPGWAARALDDVRRVLDTCRRYDAYGGTISFTLLDSDLPPQDGLIVQGRIESPGTSARSTLLVAVRHGERLSTIQIPGPVDRRTGYAVAEKLGDLLD
ncbi:hypothetical protein ACN27G_22010 [Plantactinospora sp. WMMB334]|uniref:hypothetical protein n=1 Tax=Plantactinospora sp. WMMB334 TaxID=3404119 RepID=UPI003B92CE53